MPDPKLTEYLGMWIPVRKWVHAIDEHNMDILTLIKERLRAQGIPAEIALDKGSCCVYRHVIERDIDGKGEGFLEWSRSIQTYAVKEPSEARHSRAYKKRDTG